MATIHVKVVPGAKRNRIVGRYGDAIKMQVSAPPEGGKANDAVLRLIAETLGVRPQQVRIIRGHTQPRKLIEIDGIDDAPAEAALARVTAR